jgi:KDO2-lipid IV(A) lauroyltransferase
MKLDLSKFFQSSVNIFIFSRLHPVVSYYYMQAIGRLYYALRPRERRLIESNIRDLVGATDEARIRRIVRESFEGIFLHYYEKMLAAFRSYPYVKRFVETRFRVEGLELISGALRGGKGVIVATAHFGGLEFIPWVIGLRGLPIDVIADCATPRLRRALADKISHADVRLFSNSDGQGVLFRAMGTLSDNRVLMTECDEVDAWHRRKSRTIPLFGRELYFDNTLDFLARRSGAPVVAAFLRRCGFLRYRMTFEDVSLRRQPQSVARDALILWEKYVTRYPGQWYQWKKWAAMKAA